MRILLIDQEYLGVHLNMLGQAAGHDVVYWSPPLSTGKESPVGRGIVSRVNRWESRMDWADLILNTGNAHYRSVMEPYFEKGYPILGTNEKSAELELDRHKGQQALERAGVRTLPYEICNSIDEAMAYIREVKTGCAMKMDGGLADKALSFVGESAKDCLFTLARWEAMGLQKGRILCQKKVKGIEMAAGGWFGPGGWSHAINETFEFKKHLSGDLGCNTGEQGSILRYTDKSKLFDLVARPLEQQLHALGFVGNCDVNCKIDERGFPWPLELTMRFGWPATNILMALHLGDPFEWMWGLLRGKDTIRYRNAVACGVVLSHGMYPFKSNPVEEDTGFPVRGMSGEICPQHMLRDGREWATAGDYLGVGIGVSGTVRGASRAAYRAVEAFHVPSNLGYRNDIGDRLKDELPTLQWFGYAKDMTYGRSS